MLCRIFVDAAAVPSKGTDVFLDFGSMEKADLKIMIQ